MAAARDERLYFHLEVTAARLRAEADRRCIEQAGITTAQAAALAVIHEQPGVSKRGLARALRQTEPAITTLVRRLIAAGIVDRSVDPSDGRTRSLVLTESGVAALRSVASAFSVINEHIDGPLTGDEVRHLAAALRRLSATGIDDSGRRSEHGGSHVRIVIAASAGRPSPGAKAVPHRGHPAARARRQPHPVRPAAHPCRQSRWRRRGRVRARSITWCCARSCPRSTPTREIELVHTGCVVVGSLRCSVVAKACRCASSWTDCQPLPVIGGHRSRPRRRDELSSSACCASVSLCLVCHWHQEARVSGLDGRVAVVTGVSRRAGIGFAIARRLLADGASVFCHSWSRHDAEQRWGADPLGAEGVIRALAAPEGRVDHVAFDLAVAANSERLVSAAVARFGQVDVLVVNHARSSEQSLGALTAEELDLCWAVNARASALLVQAFAAQRDDGPGGRVVLFTSGQHRAPMSRELPYAISKGAIHQMTLSLADALADRGITVNTVNPGPTDTGWASPHLAEQVGTALPRGRWNTPDEIAAVVAWLVSDDAATVTGDVIDAEAGFRRWAM